MNGLRARALLDTGASHCFIAERWAKRHNVAFEVIEQPLSIVMADGKSSIVSHFLCRDLSLCLAGKVFVHDFHVLSESSYDIILGMPWFHIVNPVIDFPSRLVRFREGGLLGRNTATELACQLTHSVHNFQPALISGKHASKFTKTECPRFLSFY